MNTPSDHLAAFVTTYQRLFPGEPVPAMPSKPEDLSMTATLALRDATLCFGKTFLAALAHRFLLTFSNGC